MARFPTLPYSEFLIVCSQGRVKDLLGESVRSALFKHDTGGLVVKWVNISESLLLYVFYVFINSSDPLLCMMEKLGWPGRCVSFSVTYLRP